LATFATLSLGPAAHARLADALSADHRLIVAPNWAALWSLVHRDEIGGCIVDPYGPDWASALREIRRLRARASALPIVVYADFRGREMDLVGLGQVQVDGILLAERANEPGFSLRTVRDAVGSALGRQVSVAVGPRLPQVGSDALSWAVARALDRPTVSGLANGVGLSTEKLATELRRNDLSPPRRFLLWGRLFRAANLLRREAVSVESVALRLGYGSGSGLARAIRQEFGHPPAQIRHRGGISCAVQALFRTSPHRLAIVTHAPRRQADA